MKPKKIEFRKRTRKQTHLVEKAIGVIAIVALVVLVGALLMETSWKEMIFSGKQSEGLLTGAAVEGSTGADEVAVPEQVAEVIPNETLSVETATAPEETNVGIQAGGGGEIGIMEGANSTNCGSVNASLTLTANITTAGTCFNISASNIVLDCNGFTVKGDKGASDYGISNSGYDNITIQNCIISTFGNGIYLHTSANRNNILNNTLTNSTNDIYIDTNSANGTIYNNTFNDEIDTYGIYFNNGDEWNVTNNTFTGDFTTASISFRSSTSVSNRAWMNQFKSSDGILNSGTGTNFCVNDIGNYYNGSVALAQVPAADCGPTPNGTVYVNQSATTSFTWKGSSATYPDLRTAVFNTWNGTNNTVFMLTNYSTSTAYTDGTSSGAVSTVRNNFNLNCQGFTFSDPTADSTINGFFSQGEIGINIYNCIISNFNYGIALGLTSSAQGINIYNNTFEAEGEQYGIYFYDGDFVNITNNTFTGDYSEKTIGTDGTGSTNTNIWYNQFFGAKGIGTPIGTNDSFCVSDIGNFYNASVALAQVPTADCGPTPNSNVSINSSISASSFSFGGTNPTYKYPQEAFYNAQENRTLFLLEPYNSTSTIQTLRNGTTLNCQNKRLQSTVDALNIAGETGTTISNCNIVTSGNGIEGITLTSSATGNSIVNTSINTTGTTAYGVTFTSSNSNYIINSTFNISKAFDIYTSSSTNNSIINSSFNLTGLGFTGAGSWIQVQWYVGVNVTDGGSGIADASVNITNRTLELLFNGVTDANGQIPQQTITEFWRNGTVIVYATPHNFSGNKTGYLSNYTQINLSATNSTNIVLTLVSLQYPRWDSNASSITTIYSPTQPSQFNITWVDDINVSSVWLESNYSSTRANYSMNLIAGNYTNGTYNYSAVLPAGTHYWKSYANDSLNQWNYTDTWAFTIARAASSVNLTLNGTSSNITVLNGTAININCSRLAGEGNVELYVNGSLVNSGVDIGNLTTFNNVGLVNATCQYNPTQNYSASSAVYWVNVTVIDYSPQWISNRTSIVTTYSASQASLFNITWTDNVNVSSVWLESNYSSTRANYSMNLIAGNYTNGTYNYSAILPAGAHYWKSYANDSANLWNSTNTWEFSIAKAASSVNLTLNGTSSNITVLNGTAININCSRLAGEGNVELYVNGSLVNSGVDIGNLTTFNNVGLVNATCQYNQTQNYSVSSAVFWVNVTAPVYPDLKINTSDVAYPTTIKQNDTFAINITVHNLGNANATNANISLYIDSALNQSKHTNITLNSSQQVQFNLTAPMGNHTFTVSIDPSNSITESNETNNNVTHSINVKFVAILQYLSPTGSFPRGKDVAGEDALLEINNTLTALAQVYDLYNSSHPLYANCSFYFNESLLGGNLTNSSGQCSYNLNKTAYPYGTYNVTINFTGLQSDAVAHSSQVQNTTLIGILVLYIDVDTVNHYDGLNYVLGEMAVLNINITQNGTSYSPDIVTPIIRGATDPVDGPSVFTSIQYNDTTGNYRYASLVNSPPNGGSARWRVRINSTTLGLIGTASHSDIDVNNNNGNISMSIINSTQGSIAGTTFTVKDAATYQLNQSVNTTITDFPIRKNKNHTLDFIAISGEMVMLEKVNLNQTDNNLTLQVISAYNGTIPTTLKNFTSVAAFEEFPYNITSGNITLPRNGKTITSILRCSSWNSTTASCSGSWSTYATAFAQNSTHVWFNITSFSGYAGGIPFSSNLTIWDEVDSNMPFGDQTRYNDEQVQFFANYTNSSSGAVITGASCNISFSTAPAGPFSMTYNTSALVYQYNRSFSSSGTYSWNVTCNNATYDTLTADDTITISATPTTPPPGGGGADREEGERKVIITPPRKVVVTPPTEVAPERPVLPEDKVREYVERFVEITTEIIEAAPEVSLEREAVETRPLAQEQVVRVILENKGDEAITLTQEVQAPEVALENEVETREAIAQEAREAITQSIDRAAAAPPQEVESRPIEQQDIALIALENRGDKTISIIPEVAPIDYKLEHEDKAEELLRKKVLIETKERNEELTPEEIELLTRERLERAKLLEKENVQPISRVKQGSLLGRSISTFQPSTEPVSGGLLKSKVETTNITLKPGERKLSDIKITTGVSTQANQTSKIIFTSGGKEVLEKEVEIKRALYPGTAVEVVEDYVDVYMMVPAREVPAGKKDTAEPYLLEIDFLRPDAGLLGLGKTTYGDLYGPFLIKPRDGFVFAQQLRYDKNLKSGKYLVRTRIYHYGKTIAKNEFEVTVLSPEDRRLARIAKVAALKAAGEKVNESIIYGAESPEELREEYITQETEKRVKEKLTSLKLIEGEGVQMLGRNKWGSLFGTALAPIHISTELITGRLLQPTTKTEEIVLQPKEKKVAEIAITQGVSAKNTTKSKVVFTSGGKEVLGKEVELTREVYPGTAVDVVDSHIDVYMAIPAQPNAAEEDELEPYSLEFSLIKPDEDGESKKVLFTDLYGPYLVKPKDGFVFAQQFGYDENFKPGKYIVMTKIYQNSETIAKNEYEVMLGGEALVPAVVKLKEVKKVGLTELDTIKPTPTEPIAKEPSLAEPAVGKAILPQATAKTAWERYAYYLLGLLLLTVVLVAVLIVIRKRSETEEPVTEELKRWITQEKQRGSSDAQIIALLLRYTTWSKEEIAQAFHEIKQMDKGNRQKN